MADTPAFQDHQLVQSKGANVATFAFSGDELKYTLVDKTQSSTLKTSYASLSRDHGFFVERNAWLMNVGLLWIALGVLLTVMRYADARELVPSMWLWLGLGCAGWAWFQTVRYVKIPNENGTLFVIEDAQKAAILAELEARRIDQLLRWHDFIDANEDPVRQRNRFNWLHEEGALDADALAERLERLGRLVQSVKPVQETALPGSPGTDTALN